MFTNSFHKRKKGKYANFMHAEVFFCIFHLLEAVLDISTRYDLDKLGITLSFSSCFFFLQIAVFIVRQMASGCNHLSFAFYLSQILFAWSVFNKCCIVQHAQYFETYSNNSECIQIYSNNSEYIQIMPNIFK